MSILTVIGIMGVAFAFSMYLETQATRQFVSSTQARYVAEAGVNHARSLLDEDRLGSRIDGTTEDWARLPAGNDVDVDGDGTRDAKWWLLTDENTATVGRYAMQITDEAGKVNLNAAQADPASGGLGSMNLTTLLERAGMPRAHEVAVAIEQYRYGQDGRPGVAGVDDDGDGAIDDPDEYQPTALRGDDRRIERLEDLVKIAGLTSDDVHRLSRVATVYSHDLNVSVSGKPRVNVNTATTEELLAVLLEAGVDDPWQVAANMADDVDTDVSLSRVTKSSEPLLMSDQGPTGGWTWQADPVGHYASEGPNTGTLSWSVSVPTGRFRALARGVSGVKVGDVAVAGQLVRSVDDGESLGMFDLTGTLRIDVVNHESAGTPCAFRGVELVPEVPGNGILVRGIEAIRFNELMVEPTMKLTLSDPGATFDPQGSDWGCPVGAGVCSNSGVGQGRWSWTNQLLPPGHYYVRVFGSAPGQTVGEVRVESQTQLLTHGQRHPSTISVGSDGKFSLTIGKTKAGQTYYLKDVTLSLQPDAEYVELINLSDQDIDLSGWTIEGELTGGRAGRLPSGSIIKAHGLLVAAVDLDDTQATLDGNGIDARTAWQIPRDANAVGLEFPSGPPSPDDDWLKTTLPSGSLSRLMLRNAQGVTVDEVQYPLPLTTTAPFQSLEKGDPTVIVDRNGDGVDEGWYPSLKLYTPGQPNDNEGLKEVAGLETIVHDPTKEITILNRPLKSIGELAGLPSGKPWKPFSSVDLAKIVDRLTVEGLRLETQNHAAPAHDAWRETAEGYEYNHPGASHPATPDQIGVWQWTDIPNGHYRLKLYGWAGEQVSIQWQRADGTSPATWATPPATDVQGRTFVGEVIIGMGETPSNTLTLQVQCLSANGICHLNHVQLDPQLLRVGPVNVNTAPHEVLLSLPGMTEARASRIIAGRPYGDQDGKGRGIGDLLIGDVLESDEEGRLAAFRQLAHLVTTRSDVFQILSVGQAIEGTRETATQRIQTVIQR